MTGAIGIMDYREEALDLKAIGTRVNLLALKVLMTGDWIQARDLAVEAGIARSIISQEMKHLCRREILRKKKKGQAVFYSLHPKKAGKVRGVLAVLGCLSFPRHA